MCSASCKPKEKAMGNSMGDNLEKLRSPLVVLPMSSHANTLGPQFIKQPWGIFCIWFSTFNWGNHWGCPTLAVRLLSCWFKSEMLTILFYVHFLQAFCYSCQIFFFFEFYSFFFQSSQELLKCIPQNGTREGGLLSALSCCGWVLCPNLMGPQNESL